MMTVFGRQLEISQTLHEHHMTGAYSRRKTLKIKKAYERYIFSQIKQFDNVITDAAIFKNKIKLFDSEASIIVSPRFYTTSGFLNFEAERCSSLDAHVTYSTNIDHDDINYIKLKDYNFYENYISDNYSGLIQYITERLRESLTDIPLYYDYHEDMRLRK